MLFSSFATLLIASTVLASPIPAWKREVPQEHSHDPILIALRPILALNNPDNIQDPVFGLLGNAAAQNGAGNIADPDCLQQATADQAFTNAKAKGDIAGMTVALQYRALERNTGSVGLASVQCTSIQAKNPEIAAIQQHQDPASANAAAINKAIVLELAKQIASIGGDPLKALETGTFAPGQIGDPTGRGNTCNDEDPNGCINTKNLLVLDATEEEIEAAVAGVSAGGSGDAAATTTQDEATTTTQDAAATATDCPDATVTVTVTAGAEDAGQATSTAAPEATSSAAPAADAGAGGNLQKFTGNLGGITAPAVVPGGRGFQVVGNNSDFLNVGAALGRSCDVQHNQCANAANSNRNAGFT
ncbi:SubName: Full=Uncharacterized protein {ECO:0000313/EMBL:CCA73998.1} [Serendipita indica DSM 11827]|nr:SubName: Full=Uncharacterized protein {ECO:0000313/EMBL:CCA73998.1} [Serendipita indica DSM 11827]